MSADFGESASARNELGNTIHVLAWFAHCELFQEAHPILDA
jgi:hypothetical protein